MEKIGLSIAAATKNTIAGAIVLTTEGCFHMFIIFGYHNSR